MTSLFTSLSNKTKELKGLKRLTENVTHLVLEALIVTSHCFAQSQEI